MYEHGSLRLVAPEITLARIEPLLTRFGITRVADLTGLDGLGIPTYAAIRPRGRLRQASMGKGLTRAAAKVSAIMEAIEVHHIEHPLVERIRISSRARLLRAGAIAPRLEEVPEAHEGLYVSDDLEIAWTEATDLRSGRTQWLPAHLVYVLPGPQLHRTSTNGLASGNSLEEARVHALLEIIERDTLSKVRPHVPLSEQPWILARVDTRSWGSPDLEAIEAAIERAGCELYVLWARASLPVHTFWAFVVDRDPAAWTTAVSKGAGTHARPDIALFRAVTEAAQTRLGAIQACREEFAHKLASETDPLELARRASARLKAMPMRVSWSDLTAAETLPSGTLGELYEGLVEALVGAGHADVLAVDVAQETGAETPISIARCVVPTMRFASWLV